MLEVERFVSPHIEVLTVKLYYVAEILCKDCIIFVVIARSEAGFSERVVKAGTGTVE